MPVISTLGAMSSRGFGGIGGGGSNVFVIDSGITSTKEMDLAAYLTSQGWNGTSPVEVTIPSGVYLWSDNTSKGGLTISSALNDLLTITNNGIIMGRGGNGGSAGGNGSAGGPALVNNATGVIFINNSGGFIAGGGGAADRPRTTAAAVVLAAGKVVLLVYRQVIAVARVAQSVKTDHRVQAIKAQWVARAAPIHARAAELTEW